MSSRVPRKLMRSGGVALGALAIAQSRGRPRHQLHSPRPCMQRSIGAFAAFTLLAASPVFADAVPLPRSMFIDAKTAQQVDVELMSPAHGFSMDQLMELAGLSVASASLDFIMRLSGDIALSREKASGQRVLVACGPGNNGGDGLVAARHLKLFGLDPAVYIPFPDKNKFHALTKQCENLGIPVLTDLPAPEDINGYSLIVDAVFGYSFKGPVRDAYKPIIGMMAQTSTPVISVDLPSGWDVEKGDIYGVGFIPAAVVSLTVPKLCMKSYSGLHYVGGRFVPPSLADKLDFEVPFYGVRADQHVLLNPPEAERAATPEGWQLYTSHDGYPYYFNHQSGQSEWALFQPPGSTTKEGIQEASSVMMVTAPNMEVAKKIARSLVQGKLAACVQLQDKVTSIYEWESVVEESTEVMLIIKTRGSLVPIVTNAIKLMHPYEIPEVISMEITGGNKDYLSWVTNSTNYTAPSSSDSA